jgi:methylglyoxal synthase
MLPVTVVTDQTVINVVNVTSGPYSGDIEL